MEVLEFKWAIFQQTMIDSRKVPKNGWSTLRGTHLWQWNIIFTGKKPCLGIPSLSTCSFQTKNKLVLCHYWFDYSKTMIRLVIYMPLLRLSIINIHKIINHKYTYHYVYMYHGPIRAPDSPREAPPRGLCGTPGTGRSATGASLRLWPQQRPGGSQTCGAVNGDMAY